MPVPAALASHYQQLLGLVKPWKITEINLDIPQQRLDITLQWPQGRKAPCPECGKLYGLKDHLPARTWRHLDAMQFKTFLHCRIPRSECKTHGARTITVPWADAGSQWTLLFEAFAVLFMQQVPSLTKAANLLGISRKEAHTLRKHAVKRGLERRTVDQIDYVGIDEKSFGRKERFITVLTDLTGERVLEVAPSKSSDAAKATLMVIPEESRMKVQAVAMDMSTAMEKACHEELPNADIVYDKFHIEKHLSDAMAKVRTREHKKLPAEGIPIFKRTRYLFLRRPERWSEKQQAQYHNIKREFGQTRFAQSPVLELYQRNLGIEVFSTLVFLGNAQSHPRSHQGRENDQNASRQYSHILPSRHYECIYRENEFKDPGNQISRSWIQEFR